MSLRSNESRTASDCRKEARPRGEPTERSKQIAALRAEGLTRAEIAERLGISKHAVSRAVGEARAAGARP